MSIHEPPVGTDIPSWSLILRLQLDVGYERAWHTADGSPDGVHSAYPFDGGEFAGPHLRGTVEPVGQDWPRWRTDGAMLIDARAMLRTDDDALISLAYTGLAVPPAGGAEAAKHFDRGAGSIGATPYARTHVRFATGDERYRWLNDVVAIGKGMRTPRGPLYSIYGMDLPPERQ